MKKVITYGSFDLFHKGHENLLRRAKALGDHLIVGVTTEQYDAQRGKLNIVDSLMARVDNVRASGYADEVIIEDHEGQKLADIQRLGVDVFAVGSDWRGAFDYLSDYCEVVYLERTKEISSTQLRTQRGILRLGVMGCGRIARRFVPEARYVSGVIAAGVCGRRLPPAQDFARRFELGFATDDYEDFLSRVDAVYIATPHETHFEYARRALEAGRHVLCEKPMVLCAAQAEALFALAAARGLVLMEAAKTAYAPAFLNLLAIAKSGRIGEIRDVEAAFTKLLPRGHSHRELTPGTGGSFTELGSYPLLAIFKLLGRGYEEVRFASFRDEDGLDQYTKAHFAYPGAMATAKTGLGVKSEGQLLVSGTRGYILVESPWWLTQSFEVCYEDPRQNERFFHKFAGEGLRYELAAFTRAAAEPQANGFQLSAADSIAMAGVMEAFLTGEK